MFLILFLLLFKKYVCNIFNGFSTCVYYYIEYTLYVKMLDKCRQIQIFTPVLLLYWTLAEKETVKEETSYTPVQQRLNICSKG